MKIILFNLILVFLSFFSFGQNNDPKREEFGNKDNLHFLSNYLEEGPQKIVIQYNFDLCLCPKWYIVGTNEPVWIEYFDDEKVPNKSDRDFDQKKISVIGSFYKYKGIPNDIYEFKYLSEKDVPNARIIRIEKIVKN